MAIISVAIPQSAQAHGFFLIDNFETYSTGLVRAVANPPWVALGTPPGTMFARTEDLGGYRFDRFLAYGWHNGVRGAYRPLGEQSLGADAVGTYFLQFRQNVPLQPPPVGGDTPTLFGLSDIAAPTGDSPFAAYRVQMVLRGDPLHAGAIELRGRSGGTESVLAGNLAVGAWHAIWLVVNNATDTFDVYLARDPYGSGTLVGSGLGFRTATVNPLTTFIAMGRGQTTGASAHDYGTHIDNIYFSPGVNLVNPIPEPSTYALIFGVLALAGVAIRRRFRKV